MNSLSKYAAVFERIKLRHADRLTQEFQLRCETGVWLDSAALKLQKPNWSDGGMSQGIFFSVWILRDEKNQNRFDYNIHALKLGSQKVCGVKPVAFARAFRSRFDLAGWPNVSIDYGPQTLMQGWQPLDLCALETDVVSLIERFVSVHPLIDELLGLKAAGHAV